jgi:ABC-2 type transport system permease protein
MTSGLAESGRTGYAVRRTLPLRVEALRQLRRRRSLIAFGLLMILPWIIAVAFELNGGSDGGGNGGNGSGTYGLSNAATSGAMNFTLFTLFVSAGFLLVVMVALFCGDTVASEANWSSLRYLLAAPVPRARLLRQKLVIALLFAAVALVSLPLMALLTGTVFFGWHDVTLPSGGTYPLGPALTRMAVIVGYSLIANLVVAALAFLLSVVTDSPLGAVGGAVGLVIISNILDSVTALGHKRDFLPTHWTYAWLDVLQPNIQWAGMIKGTAISVSYALIFLALAFRRFRTKDIVS